MKRAQLAINSVSTGGKGLEERLAAYAAAGFTHVEFALWHVKEYLQSHTPADARALLDKHGLTCIGGFEGGLECFTPPAQRAQNHAQTLENARLLHALGGTNLVVGTDGPADPKQGDPLGEMARVFAEVAQQAEPLGDHPLHRVQLVAHCQVPADGGGGGPPLRASQCGRLV